MEVKFLPTIMGRLRSRDNTDSATAHAISGSTAAITGGTGSAFNTFGGGWDVEKSVQDGYERVIWVFRCIDAISSNAAKLPMIIRIGDPDTGKILQDKDLQYTLNRRANRYETAAAFRYRLSGQLLLSKRGAFIEKKRAPSGKWQLHLLPPHLVEPVPDARDFVAGYWLHSATQGQTWLNKEDIIWIRIKPHPIDPYLQMTPLTSAGLAIETDWLSRLFNRNFLMNDGRPGLLINITGQLNKTDAQEIKDRFSGSPHTAGRTSVVESDGITVNDLSAQPRDLQWLEAIAGTKSDILLAFGTPESVLGNASGRTYDNADAEAEVWWEETMVPHCKPIGDGLDILTGSYDDDKYVTFNWDTVDVLQRRKRARHDKAREEFTSGTRTLDSLMEIRGEEPWEVPATRSLFLPGGIIVSKTPEDTAAVANLPVLGVQQQANVAKEAQRGAEMGSAQGQRNFGNIISARAMELAGSKQYELEAKNYTDSDIVDAEVLEPKEHPYLEFRGIAEEGFGRLLDDWSGFQEETVLSRLDHVKSRKFTRHWEGPGMGDKALNTRYAVDTSRWTSTLEGNIDRLMRKVTMEGLRQATAEMTNSGIHRVMGHVGLGDPSARSDLAKVFGDRATAEQALTDVLGPFTDLVKQAADRQSDRVAEHIRQMDANGASLKDIKRAVSSMIGTRSSWRNGLATALTTSLMEAARHKAYSQAGNIVTKFWNTMEDELVRKTHEAVDGKEHPISKPYRIGKYKMDFPGDPRGGIEERINCRCYNDYAISEEAEELYEQGAY
jgi:HK97 family phage portal protein